MHLHKADWKFNITFCQTENCQTKMNHPKIEIISKLNKRYQNERIYTNSRKILLKKYNEFINLVIVILFFYITYIW